MSGQTAVALFTITIIIPINIQHKYNEFKSSWKLRMRHEKDPVPIRKPLVQTVKQGCVVCRVRAYIIRHGNSCQCDEVGTGWLRRMTLVRYRAGRGDWSGDGGANIHCPSLINTNQHWLNLVRFTEDLEQNTYKGLRCPSAVCCQTLPSAGLNLMSSKQSDHTCQEEKLDVAS